MSEMIRMFVVFLVYALIFAWFFKDAIRYFKEGNGFLCGLNVALCIWEATKIVEAALML